MSIDPRFDQIVITEPGSNGVEPVTPEEPTQPSVAPLPIPAGETAGPAVQVAAAPVEAEAPVVTQGRVRTRPRWVVPAAIAALGLILSGTLAYLLYSSNSSLDATRHELGLSRASLDSSRLQVASLEAEASSKKVTADYVSRYIADSGKVSTDYEQIVGCQTYSACRTAAQQALTDMQSFQSDRQAAVVPAALNSSDGQLGDSLSAGIAALQELINGMDNASDAKFKDGFSKLDDAMLSMAKAEAALGAEIG